ncbi:rpoE leader peptide RseD [Franconibacter pulveris 1160]|uniref:RpoE leader peptide RseD n=1 Tax=Franconibacter daqui TaxID=2047724 RepID=A0ABV1PLX8_9ENTR|nr:MULTISPECIES: rpoE leader peptide RseD [Franconibacter]
MRKRFPQNRAQKQRRNGTMRRTDTLTVCLLISAEFGWRFDYAWKLGLGRHYLG